MATELKTNGAAAEYSPNKTEHLNGAGGGNLGEDGATEKYTKKEDDGDDERIPLKSSRDPEKATPVEEDEDVKDSTSLSSGQKKSKKDKCALGGEFG